MDEARATNATGLGELARVFLRLGSTAFGGPAAHLALMEDEFVRRRHWLTHEEFLDLLGATNLIPGPNSTEMAIHLGLRRAGWRGLLVAGGCFILPAAVIVTTLAWAYVRFGRLPQAEGLLYGIKPVIIAVIVQALWALGLKAVQSPWLAALALAGALASFFGANELAVLLVSGALPGLWKWCRRPRQSVACVGPILAGVLGMSGPAAAGAAAFSLGALFLFFLKVGAVLFGSGYVLLAFIRADLVDRWGWLTEGQLLDALAVGQFTPGPLFTTATFVGYLLAGTRGAVVATVGIFLPAFVFVALSGRLIPKIRASPVAGAFLDGVNVASLALMAVVTVRLGVAALVDWETVLLALIATMLLLRYRVNPVWLILGGGLLGLATAWSGVHL